MSILDHSIEIKHLFIGRKQRQLQFTKTKQYLFLNYFLNGRFDEEISCNLLLRSQYVFPMAKCYVCKKTTFIQLIMCEKIYIFN
jgi:hypothetical protein